jgi:hypothetical protein
MCSRRTLRNHSRSNQFCERHSERSNRFDGPEYVADNHSLPRVQIWQGCQVPALIWHRHSVKSFDFASSASRVSLGTAALSRP